MSRRRKARHEPKFDRTMKRLVTERDARAIRKHGKVIDRFNASYGTIVRYRYKGATYHEFFPEGYCL